jgi:hypothetical protein
MHEGFRKRLAAIEAERRLRDSEPHLVSLGCYAVEPTFAFRGDFKCWRREGESVDDFDRRAHDECYSQDPHPFQILVFTDKEISDAASGTTAL